jgi:hypothetical protein
VASPEIIVFPVYDPTSGALVSGLASSLSFNVYEDETGSTLSQPTITEIGTSGNYTFTPVFTTNHAIVYSISTANNSPLAYSGFLRPEDFATDSIPGMVTSLSSITNMVSNMQQWQQGTWKIATTGADAGKIIYYAEDGTTVLGKYFLYQADGTTIWTLPSGANAQRVKTS